MEDLSPFWQGTLLCAGVVVLLLFLTPIIVVLELRRMRKVTALFVAGRAPLTDDDFLRCLNAGPEQAAFYLVGRRAMAELCGVPPDRVHPEDSVRSLMNLQFDNGFFIDFLFALEDEVGGTLAQDPPGTPVIGDITQLSFGTLLRLLAQHWQGGSRR